MTTARHHQLFFNQPTYFHLISRCVRRAYLCGKDKVSGKRYDHRKTWLEKRLLKLADLFFIDLYGYAIMSNHYHLVIQTRPDDLQVASDAEVARRWCELFPHKTQINTARIKLLCQDKDTITLYRRRLADISWLMRCLNEGLARKANKEDGCTGRFWQGRFRSQILLDESAVYTCMAYVDLNPVRAGIATTPEQSSYTSIKYRLSHHCVNKPLQPINASTGDASLNLKLAEYLVLVDEAGRCIRAGNTTCIDTKARPILTRIKINADYYIDAMNSLSRLFYRGIGSVDEMSEFAQRLKLNWIKGKRMAGVLFS